LNPTFGEMDGGGMRLNDDINIGGKRTKNGKGKGRTVKGKEKRGQPKENDDI